MRSRPLLLMLLSAVLAAGALPVPGAAATYHVDRAAASCSDVGPGTEAQPYCTISAAVAARGGYGTTIVVKPGVYREQVTITASGSVGSPFVLRGLDGAAVVDGADDLSGTENWQPHAADVFIAPAVTLEPLQVFVDGQRLAPSLADPLALPPNSFRYVFPFGLYVNAGGGNPGLHTVHVGRRAHGFRISNRSYVTVEGFEVLRTEDRGIYITGASTGTTIRDNRVRFANHYGIALSGCQAVRIVANTTTDNQDDGISLVAGASGCVIEDNESARNVHPLERRAQGIELSGSSGNLVQRNRMHHNQDSGEHLSAGAAGNTSLQNRSWSNGDHGFDRLNSANTISIGNVAYGNFRDGFSHEGMSPGGQVFDCIAIDNGFETRRFNLWVDAQASVGFASDHNIFWNSTGAPPVKYVATIYATLAEYVAATGHDTHSHEADPRFVDAPGGDFHLLAGSPAIDAAATGMTAWPATDAEGYARVDDPAVVDSGTGPVTYADRGALEYLPGGPPPDAPPMVTAPPAITATIGSVFAMVVTAADPDGQPITSLTVTGLPPGPRFIVTPDSRSGVVWWVPGPAHAGTWTLTFTARNALAGSATTLISVVTPNQPPAAALVVSPSSGLAPLTVMADASGSSDDDGAVVSYRFEFGDGTVVGPQPEPTATHTYGPGAWTATVTVTDDRGGTASASQPVVATPAESPNLVGNPSFETDLSGWNMFLGSTLERVPGGAHGDYALQVSGLPTTGSFGVNDSPNWITNVPGAGIRYRFSAKVRSADHTGTIRLRVREYLAGVLQAGYYSNGLVLTPAWQELSVDYVTTAPGTTIDFQIVNFPATTGEVMLVDDVAIRDVTWMGGEAGTDATGRDGRPLEVRVHPTPVRTGATLSFRTSVAGALEVHLFDLEGRRVRRLLDRADAPAGVQRLDFDGRGDDGTPLRSGMYFYRVRASEGETAGRFLVVR